MEDPAQDSPAQDSPAQDSPAQASPAQEYARATPLPDGHYGVLIIDAGLIQGNDDVQLQLEVVVTAGDFKGEVVELRASGAAVLGCGDDPLELLALPGSLTVSAGVPHFALS